MADSDNRYLPDPDAHEVPLNQAQGETWQLGKDHRKVDAMERMRGVTRYTDDIKLPGMLHCKILRSPHPHANILSIDATKALAMEGVFAVITGADLPEPYGIIPWTPDETALAVGKVCHVGDGLAAVAAKDEDTALAALKAIEVEYEVLPAFYDPKEALEADLQINPYARKGNLSKKVLLEFGEVDEAIDGADLIVEGEYFYEGATHAAIEPHCAIAKVEPSGMLTVWSATQVSHYLQRELAKVLDKPPHEIRVIQPPLGGAFGGKSEPFDLEFCVAKLAQITGRPVKCLYTREEVFYAHRGRHPMRMNYRTGFTKDGKITGMDARTILDGGAYSSFGLVTTYYSGQIGCSPYDVPAYRFHSRRAYTNKPACGPKRGHGSVQPRFAVECQLDKAAVQLDIDPIDRLRQRQWLSRGLEWLPRLPRGGAQVLQLGRAPREDGLRQGPGRGRLDLHLGHELPHLPQRHAPSGGADLRRPQRTRTHLLRRERHRSGLEHDARGRRLRRTRCPHRGHPRAFGRHGPVPRRPGGLLLAHHLDGGQCLSRRGPQAAS
jgi:CO/xanthine dehydrogenase Mo-binding subunit